MKNMARLQILRFQISAFQLCAGLLFFAPAIQAQVNVTQHHNHLSRDGVYIDPAFTPALAAQLARDTNFNGTIQGDVYAQPLYIENGPRGRAVVIAVTESNNVYALDAVNGGIVWRTNVGLPVPSGVLPCGDVQPVGISGTPAVDLATRALFFDAMIYTNGLPKHFIFSLNVDTGSLNPGWPINVDSNAVSTFGTTSGTRFNSLAQGERGALAVVGTNLYVPFGGISGDCGSYHGWLVSMPIANPTQVTAWATSVNGGGAWSVGGIASDGTNVFMATGNTFGASTWSGGEAIIHFSSALTLSTANTNNYWAPQNWTTLDANDLDIGGSGPLIVNVPGATPSALIVALGKDGNAYLLNRTNLGGISLPIASAHVASGSIIQAAATYTTSKGTYVVFSNNNNLYAFRITPTSPPTITNIWSASENGRGSPFVTSTDGTNNFIVWGIGSESDQRLHAFDGDTGTNIYTGGGANELMAGTRRFNTAIAARGRIYVANDNKVYAFTVPGQTVSSVAPGGLQVSPTGNFQFGFTNVPGALFNVFGTTNLTEPFTNWAWLGEVPEVAPGQFLFTNQLSDSSFGYFYRVSAP